VCKDGKIIWCRWINTPIVDSAGRVQGVMCLARDISDEMQNEERLRLWGSVIQHSSEAIIICDAKQRIVQVNRAFEEITGYTEAEAIGRTPRILKSGKHDREFYRRMWREVTQRGQWRGEVWNRRKNGDLYVEWLALGAVRDDSGAIAHFVGIFSDITARKQIEERVRHLAHFDPLTDLPNRAQLVELATQTLKIARRDRRKLALLVVDLDRFKTVNDSMGHDAGDELLIRVADRLRRLVRSSDIVARLGGDEFAVLIPHLDSMHAASAVAQKVLDSIRAPLTLRNHELSVSGSVGICVFPDGARDAGELIRNADAAMYHAKNSGRNGCCFYTSDMNDKALEVLATETALRRALERDEFVLHYQPQIDIRTGATVGLEALIRWQRPDVGLVMPGHFIPIAEERGLIGAIGEWTLRECARQAKEWDRSGVPPLPIAVNLSASEFHQQGFVDRVEQTIARFELRPERIELEITEGVIVRDAQGTIDTLERLHRFGVRLSIDDFGTGYSSLNYLRRFPIDKIKIDQSFVREMLSDRGAAGIVRGIVELAKSLELQVIAEGVETDAQLRFLAEARCDVAQGFLFSRGLPPTELQRWLQTRAAVKEAGGRVVSLARASA
jgi:diguanylate cyclase (GGDEF)-like protein/PAS domain S-box-containing protein